MNIKPYSSGNKIKRNEKPKIGKPRNKIETKIEEVAINFSSIKHTKVTGKIRVKKAYVRSSFRLNEPTYRLIKRHNTPKHKISFSQGIKSILNFII